jgi:hypothetical protein
MSVQVKFSLGWKEYYEAQEFFRRSRHEVAPESVVGAALGLLAIILLLARSAAAYSLAACAAGAIVYLATPWLRRLTLKRRWARRPVYQAEHSVSFEEQGINYLMGWVESNFGWGYYERLLESPGGFLLVYGNDSFSLLPKRAFASEQSIDEFRALAAAKLKSSAQ